MASPIVAATLQATFLAMLSNVLAQLINCYRHERALALSLPELARFVFLNLMTAPLNFHWQIFLERTFPARPVSAAVAADAVALDQAERGEELVEMLREDELEDADADVDEQDKHHAPAATTGGNLVSFSWRNTLLKFLADGITIGALGNTTLFLIGMGAMKGKNLQQIGESLRKDTIPIILASYQFWPLASIVSFTFVPVERRVVFGALMGLCWGVYMSLVASVV